jgi:hypothetical protein
LGGPKAQLSVRFYQRLGYHDATVQQIPDGSYAGFDFRSRVDKRLPKAISSWEWCSDDRPHIKVLLAALELKQRDLAVRIGYQEGYVSDVTNSSRRRGGGSSRRSFRPSSGPPSHDLKRLPIDRSGDRPVSGRRNARTARPSKIECACRMPEVPPFTLIKATFPGGCREASERCHNKPGSKQQIRDRSASWLDFHELELGNLNEARHVSGAQKV